MGILYRTGDVLKALKTGDIDVVGHGVNCSGGFGSGIAEQIAEQFPKVRTKYRKDHKERLWTLGRIDPVAVEKGYIVNCATQRYYGSTPRREPGGMYCNYPAIRECMTELKEFCQEKNLIVGIPMIGAGRAGGNWLVIEEIIDEVFNDMTILVYKKE